MYFLACGPVAISFRSRAGYSLRGCRGACFFFFSFFGEAAALVYFHDVVGRVRKKRIGLGDSTTDVTLRRGSSFFRFTTKR